MAGSISWQSGSPVFPIQLSGQGRQITNGEIYLCSGILYNDGRSGQLAFMGTAELTCSLSGFGANVQANQNVDLYLIPSIDGTNFPTASTSGLPFNGYAGSFTTPVSGNVGRLRMAVDGIVIQPNSYQTWLYNNTGQTLTSGWSLAVKPSQTYFNG